MMAEEYTTGKDAKGNWYVYNRSADTPFAKGMMYYGSDTDRFNQLKSSLNQSGAKEIWEGYQKASSTTPTENGNTAQAKPALNQAAVDATQLSIDQLGGILAGALANAQTGYDNATKQFNAQEAQQRKQYDESTLNNQKNYDANLMASIRAGGQGLSGLMSALRGGGGGGNQFAQDWVQNTVGNTTANDIREGFNTFDENRSATDNALSTFLTNLQGKRQENEDVLENNRRAAQREYAASNQDLLQKMAGLYSDAGYTGRANEFIGRSSAFTPQIAQNSGAKVSAYNTTPVEVSSPNVSAFSAPEQQASGATEGRLGQGIFSVLDPRRKERDLAVA